MKNMLLKPHLMALVCLGIIAGCIGPKKALDPFFGSIF
jgi:hypothetical protein